MGYEEYCAAQDKQKREALSRQNALLYFLLCQEEGVSRGQLVDVVLYEHGFAEYRRQQRQKSQGWQTPKIDYQAFGKAFQKYRPSPDPFQDSDIKRIIYRKAGYTHLYGENGERILLEDAGDARVGSAFVKTCEAYKRWKQRQRQSSR